MPRRMGHRDQRYLLVGFRTLNRIGLAPQLVEQYCFVRTVSDPRGLDAPLVALLLEQHLAVLEEIVPDVDATHDPLYTEEKARDFHSRSLRDRRPPRYVTSGRVRTSRQLGLPRVAALTGRPCTRRSQHRLAVAPA
ncbi:MAG: hypothetical protein OXN97_02295 [Bryobacterales bacterium]|nr:hypothetical protein [Bryobacterales bacterium]